MPTMIPLPISVVIPIKEACQRAEHHLALNQEWLPWVSEIIVVDSYSKDGSLDFLKENLEHPKVRFLQHPPGLYASWNFGISQVQSPYTYISTIGDGITYAGLAHLLESLEHLDCDVMVSPPEFMFDSPKRRSPRPWPIHEMVRILSIDKPTVLERDHLYNHTVYYLTKAVLGSSSSNLYKSQTLKKCPFPEKYGRKGDSAWAIKYNYEVSIGFTPKVISTFLWHEKESSQGNKKQGPPKRPTKEKLMHLASAIIHAQERAQAPEPSDALKKILETLRLQEEKLKHEQIMDAYRQGNRLQYLLHPKVLHHRWMRQQSQKKLHHWVFAEERR